MPIDMPISQDQPPTVEVSIDGRPVAATYLKVDWFKSSFAVNRIAEARLLLVSREHMGAGLKQFEQELGACLPGRAITVKIKGGATLFEGIVAKQKGSLSIDQAQVELVLRHPLQHMANNLASAVFADQTDDQVVRALCRRAGITLEGRAKLGVKHEQLVQYRCSDLAFVRLRLQANNVWLVPTMRGARLMAPMLEAGAPDHVLRANVDIGGGRAVLAESTEWQYDSVEQPRALAQTGWDVTAQQVRSALCRSAPVGSGGLGKWLDARGALAADWAVPYGAPLAEPEVRSLAEARLTAARLHATRGSFRVQGSTAYAPGQSLELQGFGANLDGRAVITEVRQEMVEGSWRSELSIGLEAGLAQAAQAPLPGIAGLHVGVVQAHRSDPAGLNRLRVAVAALQIDGGALWARLAMPYASTDSGLCLYPEEGDEVVVSFLDHDPRHPIVLGAMHNPRRPAPYLVIDEPGRKELVLQRDGKLQRLGLDQRQDSVYLERGDDLLRLDQDGARWATAGALVQQAKSWQAKADQEVVLEGGKSATVKAPKIDLKN